MSLGILIYGELKNFRWSLCKNAKWCYKQIYWWKNDTSVDLTDDIDEKCLHFLKYLFRNNSSRHGLKDEYGLRLSGGSSVIEINVDYGMISQSSISNQDIWNIAKNQMIIAMKQQIMSWKYLKNWQLDNLRNWLTC